MSNIYQTIKSHFTPEVISKIATLLGENNAQIESAAKTAVPTLLAGFLEQGNSGKIKNILKEAQDQNVLNEKDGIYTEKGQKKLEIGEKFLDIVSEGNQSAVASLIASNQLMSNTNSKRFLTMVSTVVAGILGKRLAANDGKLEKILGEVDGERNAILADIPMDYRNKLKINSQTVNHTENKATKKKGNKWIWWILAIIAILLLIWALRSCKSCNRVTEKESAAVIVENTAPVQTIRETYELSLPNGQKLIVYRGGIEDKMVKFLESDEYKTATNDDLKKHWFEFDAIDFEFDSGTVLKEGSAAQVNNIAAILNHYTAAKVKIGGMTDKVGSENVNMAISELRANTIKNMFVSQGVAAARISTEGFGEEYAVIPADATNEQRSPDRDIAIRFVK